MSELNFYISVLVDGITYGMIYGIFALSIVFLFRANKLFNFALTEIATLCTVGATFLLTFFSLWTTIVITLIGSFLLGSMLHLFIMRFVTERRQVLHSNEAVFTIGLYMVFNNISAFILGDNTRPFPALFGNESFEIHGVSVSWQSIGVFGITLLLVLMLNLLFKFTKLGLMFEAVAENIVAARLRGIRASNVLAMAWGISVLLAALGGILVAPTLFVSPTMLLPVYGYALIAVIIGGLESPLGAMVGGIIVGIVENLAASVPFIGTDFKFATVLFLLIVVLALRPRGIWGRAEGRRA